MPSDTGNEEKAGASPEVTIRFVPLDPSRRRNEIPDAPISVPARFGRGGLSKLCNHFLGLEGPATGRTSDDDDDADNDDDNDKDGANKAILFDFFVQRTLLRHPLGATARALGHSRENVLVVEYTEARPGPEEAGGGTVEDWISALDVRGAGPGGPADGGGAVVAVGSFDGTVRVFDLGELKSAAGAAGKRKGGKPARGKKGAGPEPVASFSAHGEDPVAAVCWARPGTALLTCGHDSSVRMWQWDGESLGLAQEMLAHSGPVQCAAVAPNEAIAASGGWDSTVRLWRVPREEEALELLEAAAAAAAARGSRSRGKRSRAEADPAGAVGEPARPLTTFMGHSQRVDGISWASMNAVHTASWDQTVRRWDAESGVNVGTMSSGSAALCVAALAEEAGGEEGSPIVASGHADFRVRLWDPRSGAAVPASTFSSHKGWVSSVSWRREGTGHSLVSASYDGTVKVWDVRSDVPLHTISAHASSKKVERAMAVDWFAPENAVVSGGTDGKIVVNTVFEAY